MDKNNEKSQGRFFFLLIRAVLFAICLSFPQIAEYYNSEGHSKNVFNDPDEMFYLRAAIDNGKFLPLEAVYKEHSKPQDLLSLLNGSRPEHTFVPFTLGMIARAFRLGPAELGLLLDLLFVTVAYLVFAFFFKELCDYTLTSELAAVVFLALPWLFSANNYLHLNLTKFIPASSPLYVSHTTLPVLEAIGSQISYPIFALALLLLIRAFHRSNNKTLLFLSGVSGGLLIYCYFFAWACFVSIGIIMICLECRGKASSPVFDIITFVARDLLFFCVAILLISMPGIIQIFSLMKKDTALTLQGEIYRNLWYFSLEWSLILAFLLYYYSHFSLVEKAQLRIGLIVACIISEFMLMNLQPLLKISLQPIFFSLCYLHPLITGVTFCLLFEWLYSRSRFRKFSNLVAILLVVVVPLKTYAIMRITFKHDQEFSELVKYIKGNIPENSVFAVMTYDKPFEPDTGEYHQRSLPNALAALTPQHLLKEAWGLDSVLPPEEQMKRELAQGFVFSGVPRLVRACPKDLEGLHRMSFFQQWVAYQLRRLKACRLLQGSLRNYSYCEILDDFQIDYILWEKQLLPDKYAWFADMTELVWQSSESKYELYKFDLTRAKKLFCFEDSPSRPLNDS